MLGPRYRWRISWREVPPYLKTLLALSALLFILFHWTIPAMQQRSQENQAEAANQHQQLLDQQYQISDKARNQAKACSGTWTVISYTAVPNDLGWHYSALLYAPDKGSWRLESDGGGLLAKTVPKLALYGKLTIGFEDQADISLGTDDNGSEYTQSDDYQRFLVIERILPPPRLSAALSKGRPVILPDGLPVSR